MVLITFANSLDPDQDRQNVGKPFDTLIVFLKEIFEKKSVSFEKKSADNKNMKSYQACKELIFNVIKFSC